MALSPNDQEIVDLYHEGSTLEPPATLDAAILAAARAAVAEPPARARPVRWWQRFAMPMQFSASFVLVAMLTVLATRESDVPDILKEEHRVASAASSSPSSPSSDAAPAAPAVRQAAPIVPAPVEMSGEPRSAKQAARPQRKASEVSSEASRVIASEAAAPSPPPPSVPEPAKASIADTAARPLAAAPAAPRALAKAERAEASSAPSMASSGEGVNGATRSTKEWIDEISSLLDQGKLVDARRQAEAFRKAYPEQSLPDDLKRRLAP